jgi:hypothetical protein
MNLIRGIVGLFWFLCILSCQQEKRNNLSEVCDIKGVDCSAPIGIILTSDNICLPCNVNIASTLQWFSSRSNIPKTNQFLLIKESDKFFVDKIANRFGFMTYVPTIVSNKALYQSLVSAIGISAFETEVIIIDSGKILYNRSVKSDKLLNDLDSLSNLEILRPL